MKKYTVAIAGTTKRTVFCAQELINSNLLKITWVLTPKPKIIGQKKTTTPNPVDAFAKQNNIPIVFIEKNINDITQKQINNLENNNPDFLLVVDFGYLIPKWLLKLPKIAPLNIHPSQLPRWRGSSPGQFSILFNDKKSAITLMIINEKLDQGDIVHQDYFKVDQNWTQKDYYEHAFDLMIQNLDQKINKLTQSKKNIVPQPQKSPTIVAKMIKKNQAFVKWQIVKKAMSRNENENIQLSSKLLSIALKHNHSLSLTLERASKAFNPWPHLWTIIPTSKGKKRMKLLDLELSQQKLLILKTVQVEGKKPTPYQEVKNIILN